MKPVRFKDIPIAEKCRIDSSEQLLKIEEVRIKVNDGVEFRNAVDLNTGELLLVDSAQWVWTE